MHATTNQHMGYHMFEAPDETWEASLFKGASAWDEVYATSVIRPHAMDIEVEFAPPWTGKPLAMQRAGSNYSPVSGRSPTSGQSPMSTGPHSPFSVPGHSFSQHTPNMGSTPGIAGYDDYTTGGQYTFGSTSIDGIEFATSSMDMPASDMVFPVESLTGVPMLDYDNFAPVKGTPSVDPSILHATYNGTPGSATQSHDSLSYTWGPGGTPLTHQPMSPMPVKAGSQSPYQQSYDYAYPTQDRRPSQVSYLSDNTSNDNNQKQFCTYPDCGKAFKDIKAHMLTHQATRPEKCPIVTCEYFLKGFSRRYDRNRHTLTHYKGTMVCGFCEGAGSAQEKSFNRADVFKRHLIKHHKVEQTPPNSRKKAPSTLNNSSKKLAGKATGNCSTCSMKFTNAQDFYEHLDDCILRVVQMEEPSEAVNQARLAEVEHDPEVHDTLRNNQLPTSTHLMSGDEDDEEEELDDENDESFSLRGRGRKNRNPKNGVQKTAGLTRSKGGVTLNTKSRRRRKDYPSSWGCQEEHMTLKKRVLCTFNGTRRLQKDDMMLRTNHEVRMSLAEPNRYVTDFDYYSLMRTEGMHSATDEERGPDNGAEQRENPVDFQEMLAENDIEKLMETGSSAYN